MEYKERRSKITIREIPTYDGKTIYAMLISANEKKRSVINKKTGKIRILMRIPTDMVLKHNNHKMENLKTGDFLDITDEKDIKGLALPNMLVNYSFVDYDLSNVMNKYKKLKKINKNIEFYKNSKEVQRIYESTNNLVRYSSVNEKYEKIGGAFKEQANKENNGSGLKIVCLKGKDLIRSHFTDYFIRNEKYNLKNWMELSNAEYPFVKLRDDFYITFSMFDELVRYGYLKVEHYRQGIGVVYNEEEYKNKINEILMVKGSSCRK